MNNSSRRTEKHSKRRYSCRATGQALAEGTAVLVLLVGISLGLIIFVLDTGMTLNYQQKITYLASQAATYMSVCANGWQYQNTGGTSVDINSFVNNLAKNMGFESGKVTAVATPVAAAANTGPVQYVTVSGTNLPLMPGLNFLPVSISVQQTFCANTNLLPRPTGLLSICVTGQSSGNTVLVPCYSGLATADKVANRAQGDSEDPEITGGDYDQFEFFAPASAGAAMNYTKGTRGMNPE